MSDSYGQGGNNDGNPPYGGSGSPPPPPPGGGSGYPPPPGGGSGYPPPPGGGSGYPPPPGGGSGYPPPPGGGSGYPPPPGGGSGYPPPPGQGPGQPYPGQGGHGSGYPGGGWDSERPRGWSGLAIASFIVGLLIPCLGLLVAVPLGIVALVKIRKSGDKGKVFAILGIVISILWLAVAGGFIAWVATTGAERNDAGDIVESGRLDYGDIRVGDCLRIDGLDSDSDINAFDVDGVPCADEHNAEAVATLPVPGSDYPGESAVRDQSAQCNAEAAPFLTGGLAPYSIYPTEELWDSDGGDRIICFVVRSDFSDMSGRQVPQ